MTAVSSMHEQVHERTNEQRQIDERTQEVRPVLGEDKQSGDHQEADQDEPCRRGEKSASRLIVMAQLIMQRVFLQRHGMLPSQRSDVIRMRRPG
jgi:hypothetical protein